MTATGTPEPTLHQRLVVGFDGSESSLSAIEWAASEAESRGACVRVISSYSMEPVTDFGSGASGSGFDMTEIAAGVPRSPPDGHDQGVRTVIPVSNSTSQPFA